jgi:acetyl-CoA carboxylase biotin carboxyl carrier protein
VKKANKTPAPKTAAKPAVKPTVVKAAAKAAAKAPAAKAAPETPAPKIPDSAESARVRQLASVLNETGLSEIEYESGGVRIRVAKHAGGGVMSAPAPVYLPAAASAPVAAEAPASKPVDVASHPGTVKSPMVGVFYLLPEPGAAPFIKVGDSVAEGQTLALIEAMKTFNPVKAPRGGKVVKILVESGSPVEYGEPLVIVE